MSAAFRLDSLGGHEIALDLGELAERMGDLTPLMQIFGVTLEAFTVERFDTETAPDGSEWQQSVRAREDGGKTLTDTSQLRSSIHSVAGRNFAEIGSNKIYAGVHNEGATIVPKNGDYLAFQLPGGLGFRRVKEVQIPQRQFLPIGGLPFEYEQELIAQADDYARGAIGGAQ